MSELFATTLCHLITADEVLCVASIPLRSCTSNVGANYVWTLKCVCLRAFNTMCLIKQRKKFELAT